MDDPEVQAVVEDLRRAGYRGLFEAGERSQARTVWRGGEHREALEAIVRGDRYADLERVLASEVLHRCAPDFPPPGWDRTLGAVYARGLALTGVRDAPIAITANDWGLLFHARRIGARDGPLGEHLLQAGAAAVGPLTELLDDPAPLLFVGSQEATLGGELDYRVKDAAAYFISRLRGQELDMPAEHAARDEVIAQLRGAVAADG